MRLGRGIFLGVAILIGGCAADDRNERSSRDGGRPLAELWAIHGPEEKVFGVEVSGEYRPSSLTNESYPIPCAAKSSFLAATSAERYLACGRSEFESVVRIAFGELREPPVVSEVVTFPRPMKWVAVAANGSIASADQDSLYVGQAELRRSEFPDGEWVGLAWSGVAGAVLFQSFIPDEASLVRFQLRGGEIEVSAKETIGKYIRGPVRWMLPEGFSVTLGDEWSPGAIYPSREEWIGWHRGESVSRSLEESAIQSHYRLDQGTIASKKWGEIAVYGRPLKTVEDTEKGRLFVLADRVPDGERKPTGTGITWVNVRRTVNEKRAPRASGYISLPVRSGSAEAWVDLIHKSLVSQPK